jgi:hypothetical protein
MKASKGILAFALLIGSVGFSQENSPEVGYTNINVGQYFNFDTSKWTNIFNQEILNGLGGIGSISTPIGDIELGKILGDLYSGISCLIPTYKQEGIGFNFKLPSSITIPLPCKDVKIYWSGITQEIGSKITGSVNGLVPEKFKKCLKEPLSPDCVKDFVVKQQKREYEKLDDYLLEHNNATAYENKSNQEIQQEIANDTKSLSTNVLPVGDGKKNTYNKAILQADLGQMKYAGNSYGKFVYPDKKQAQPLPSELKPLYGWAVSKQVAREKVIQTFQNRIDEVLQELNLLKQEIESYCSANIKAIPVIPPSMGGVGSITNLDKFKQIALNRCCCCDAIPTIHSAEHNVITRIQMAEQSIVQAIHQESFNIRRTIATEEWNTRKQIHNEFMNYQLNLKLQKCLFIKLEYLKIKEKAYDMMLQLAQLEVLYSLLNNQERKLIWKKYQEIKKNIAQSP